MPPAVSAVFARSAIALVLGLTLPIVAANPLAVTQANVVTAGESIGDAHAWSAQPDLSANVSASTVRPIPCGDGPDHSTSSQSSSDPRVLGLLGCLALVTTAGAGWRLRLRTVSHQAQALEALVRERTEQLHEATLTDPLTGLRNRRYLAEILEDDLSAFRSLRRFLLRQADRRSNDPLERQVFGIFQVDLDHFKLVNDTYGHAVGDRVLQHVAAVLKATVRADDAVVRLGGEEFLVVLKRTDREYLAPYAAKVLRQVAEAPIDLGDGRVVTCTCSIGYTEYPLRPEQPDLFSFDECHAVADQALYVAKRYGRNRAVAVRAGEVIPAPDRVAQATRDLEHAVADGFLTIDAS